MTAAQNQDWTDWIGRTETRLDRLSADAVMRLSATLDRDDPAIEDGDPLPLLSHWLAFLPRERQSALGADGHAKRGGFLPPIDHLPRRMWAGSRLTFAGILRAGMIVERRSTITAIEKKAARTGELVFVTVKHEIAEPGQTPLVTDQHDIVYRQPASSPSASAAEKAPEGDWHRSLVPDPVMLFRYSALTFNGHRIHYDRDYVTTVENYPGLVVHGPLTATLLLDLVRRHIGDDRIAAFDFRAVSPLFAGNRLHLHGSEPDNEGRIRLWATNEEGELAMRANASLKNGGAP